MSKGASHVTAHVTALAALVALSGDGAPALVMREDGSAEQRVRLLPMGAFQTRGKGRFVVSDIAHARQIVAASAANAGAQDMPGDYDHQLLAALKLDGKTAEASGWIKPASLSAEADGVYGLVEWTADAAAKIGQKKYRYVSPVIDHDQNGRVKAILNFALTNYPAIDGLTRLAASGTLNPPQEDDMDLSALAASLGLPADATLDQIMTAQTVQATALSAARADNAALKTAVGVDKDADQTTALSAATALTAGKGDQTALMASMQASLTALTAERNERVIDDAIKAGKVTPAQKPHFVALMASDPATAKALIESTPVKVEPGTALAGQPTGKITALSAEQEQVAALLGVPTADYLATLQKENGQ